MASGLSVPSAATCEHAGWHTFKSRDEAARIDELLQFLGDRASIQQLLAAMCVQFRLDKPVAFDCSASSTPATEPDVQQNAVLASTCASDNLPFIDGLEPTFRIFICPACGAEGDGVEAATPAADTSWWHRFDVERRAALAVGRATGWSHFSQGSNFVMSVEITQHATVERSRSGGDVGQAHTLGAFRITGQPGRNLWKKLSRSQSTGHALANDLDQFRECRAEAVMRYDTCKYPFAAIFAELLELMPSDSDGRSPEDLLAQVHTKPLTRQPEYFHLPFAFKAAGHAVPPEFRQYNNKLKARLEGSDRWRRFVDVYRCFVHDVCAPLCGSERVVFQCPPTVRTALPGAPATIQMHCDADYPVHWAGEVNFWVPLTSVYGSNTLWLESKPNAGDFRPMELGPGEFLRFHGYECRHYTMRNETTTARISFDFRAIPEALCHGRPVGMIGDYPAVLS